MKIFDAFKKITRTVPVILMFPVFAYSATIVSTSCTQGAVQAAINAAVDGDTVQLPVGSSTWTASVTCTGKAITIQGARTIGAGESEIIDGTPISQMPLEIVSAYGKFFRVTGLTFRDHLTANPTKRPEACIRVSGNSKSWRIDHCYFMDHICGVDAGGAWSTKSPTYGLIDHCTFYFRKDQNTVPIAVFIGGDDSFWNEPLSMGTSIATYVEDCFFYIADYAAKSGDLDTTHNEDGSKMVFRHNTCNGQVEIWGVGNCGKSSVSAEVYDNVFYSDGKNSSIVAISFSGGTGVVFNNIMRNTNYSAPFMFSYPYRECDYSGNCFAWQQNLCDGTSSIDGNLPGMKGWPCYEQPGRGPGIDLVNGTTVQKSEPVYEWNNFMDGAKVGFSLFHPNTCTPDVTDHIKERRDYYNDTPRPGYFPYQYPHPLQLTDITDLTPPSNISAVRDGAAVNTDALFTYSTAALSANWTQSSDAESGVARYLYAIGTAAGGTDIAAWTDNGTATVITKTGLALSQGSTYYFTVKAENGKALPSAAANSNGQYVALLNLTDITPPSDPLYVYDGSAAGVDAVYTDTNTTLSANWTSSADADSGIARYWVAIGTEPSGTSVLGWTDNAMAASITKTGLNLIDGATYYFSVKVENGAGLLSAVKSSNGARVMLGVVFRDDFENWVSQYGNWFGGNAAAGTIGITTEQKKLGNNSVKLMDTSAILDECYLVKDLPLNCYQYDARFYFYFPAGFFTGWGTNDRVSLMRLWDTTANRYVIFTISKTGVVFQVNKSWDGAYPGVTWEEGRWYCLEVRAPAPSSTATVKCWLDGAELASFNTNLGDAHTWNQLQVGLMDAVNALMPTLYVDEVAVADFYIGPAGAAAPSIMNISASVSGTAATIAFNTDISARSEIDYGTSASYGSTVTEGFYAQSHSIAVSGLTTGQTYHYRIRSRNLDGLETASADKTLTVGTVTPPANPEVKAYPNPASFSNGSTMVFRFSGNSGGEVKIFTISGDRVNTLTTASGSAINWDGKNDDGQRLASGIYIYKITSANGDKVTGKLAVTR